MRVVVYNIIAIIICIGIRDVIRRVVQTIPRRRIVIPITRITLLQIIFDNLLWGNILTGRIIVVFVRQVFEVHHQTRLVFNPIISVEHQATTCREGGIA